MKAADTRNGAKSGSEFRLGDLRVDPQTGDVTGPGGRAQLDPKVMGVLAMLAERAGQVVPREDLISRLWPGVVVTDDALSRCLYDLRRELAAAGGSDEYRALVETLPKRGYRLNGVAESIEPPAAANHSSRRGPRPSRPSSPSSRGSCCHWTGQKWIPPGCPRLRVRCPELPSCHSTT